MSLDVSLYRKGTTHWDDGSTEEIKDYVCDLNITHNLNKMASELGVYEHLWRPDEIGVTKAWELIEPLSKALEQMDENPNYYRKFDAPNGWGTFEGLMCFIERYLEKCKEYPNSYIEVSR